MDPTTTLLIASSGLAVLLLALLILTRVAERRERGRSTELRSMLADRTRSLEQTIVGEREAAWAHDAAQQTLTDERRAHSEDRRRLRLARNEVDDLREALAGAEAEIDATRRRLDETETEVARLESDLAVVGRLEAAAAESTAEVAALHASLADAEREFEAARTVADQQVAAARSDGDALIAELGDLRARLADAQRRLDGFEAERIAVAGERDVRDRLVASEAQRRDLEDRLDALRTVRATEGRVTAEKIRSLERLQAVMGEREARIAHLEADLKQVLESREELLESSARLDVEVGRLRSELASAGARLHAHEALEAELSEARQSLETMAASVAAAAAATDVVERLRRDLDAERARSERLARRAADAEAQSEAGYAQWDRVVRDRVATAVARDTGRLSEEIEHLREVVAEKERRIRALTGGDRTPRTAGPLPVTAIRGVGPVIAAILADQGITTLEGIAALGDADVERLGGLMPVYPGRIRDDDWVGQARHLLAGDGA